MVQNGQRSLFRETEDYQRTERETMNFDAERNCFKHLKENLSGKAKTEYELGVKRAITKYNTTIRENRFLVGGIVEVFTLALMRSTGIEIEACGKDAVRGDLILPSGEMFSVKSCFTKASSIKLINTLGDSNPSWNTATLFVLSNYGIVYGDPTMKEENDLTRTRDSLNIKRKAFTRFAQDSSNLIEMNIPLKPPLEMDNSKDIESITIAIKLMHELEMVNLLSYIKESETGS